MTERQLHRLREQWDKAHSRWSTVCRALEEMRDIEYELRRECERLAEIIAEHGLAPIMVVEPIVITEDDGDAT